MTTSQHRDKVNWKGSPALRAAWHSPIFSDPDNQNKEKFRIDLGIDPSTKEQLYDLHPRRAQRGTDEALLELFHTSDEAEEFRTMLANETRTEARPGGVRVGPRLGQSLGLTLSQCLGLSLGLSLGQRLGQRLGLSLGQRLGLSLDLSFGQRLRQCLGQSLGLSLSQCLGQRLGQRLGQSLGLRYSMSREAEGPRRSKGEGGRRGGREPPPPTAQPRCRRRRRLRASASTVDRELRDGPLRCSPRRSPPRCTIQPLRPGVELDPRAQTPRGHRRRAQR